MAIPIGKLRGMSYDLEARLKEQGIYTSDQFLEVACTPAGRQALAAQVKVSTHAILELANRADLARVRGIGGVFSDLLEHAGVDTAKELAERRPDNLHAKLLETNAQARLAGRMPTMQAVADWVARAKELPRLMEY
jgi:predicted flap endonuclease-1-like 5' DNA nuclease